MKLDTFNLKKFSKQIILKKVGIDGQRKIFKAKVLIIGVGGLGCPIILYLANSGVGNLGIIDDDKIDLSNLNRQILFTRNDIGKFKVDVAKKKIKEIDKKINVKIFKKKINKSNIKNIFRNYDIICDGTDNFTSRYLINDNCLKMGKILISGAVNKFEGHLYKFNFKKKTSCYRCFMPDAPLNNEDGCGAQGIIPPVAGLIGSLQAFEVIKAILDTKPDLSSNILIFDGLKNKIRTIKLPINKQCINKC